jgi:hypothetical protein
MILTTTELRDMLHHEVRVLLHLTTKVDRAKLDYRPTAKQRSTMELLRYLTVMGPGLLAAGVTGVFDRDAWSAKAKAAESLDFDAVCAALAAHEAEYTALVARLKDDSYQDEVEIFGRKSSRGVFLVRSLLQGLAMYRMQFFLYLKASGREELTTSNLNQGVDPAKP